MASSVKPKPNQQKTYPLFRIKPWDVFTGLPAGALIFMSTVLFNTLFNVNSRLSVFVPIVILALIPNRSYHSRPRATPYAAPDTYAAPAPDPPGWPAAPEPRQPEPPALRRSRGRPAVSDKAGVPRRAEARCRARPQELRHRNRNGDRE